MFAYDQLKLLVLSGITLLVGPWLYRKLVASQRNCFVCVLCVKRKRITIRLLATEKQNIYSCNTVEETKDSHRYISFLTLPMIIDKTNIYVDDDDDETERDLRLAKVIDDFHAQNRVKTRTSPHVCACIVAKNCVDRLLSRTSYRCDEAI
jgi:ribonuclease HII